MGVLTAQRKLPGSRGLQLVSSWPSSILWSAEVVRLVLEQFCGVFGAWADCLTNPTRCNHNVALVLEGARVLVAAFGTVVIDAVSFATSALYNLNLLQPLKMLLT